LKKLVEPKALEKFQGLFFGLQYSKYATRLYAHQILEATKINGQEAEK